MVIKTASDVGTARSDVLAAEGAGDSMDVHDARNAQALSSSQMSKSKLILTLYVLLSLG